jgi:hypothetical protein
MTTQDTTGRNPIEAATDVLRELVVRQERLSAMGVSVPFPPGLVDACRGITRLAGRPHMARRPRPRTVRCAVLTVIRPGETVKVGAVVGRLEAAGLATNPDTVSNELSRWTRQGVLDRPARGTYRWRALTGDERAELAGLSLAGPVSRSGRHGRPERSEEP